MSTLPEASSANFVFTIALDSAKEWRWQIKSAHNGKIVGASSEGFDSKQNCLKNLKLMGDAIKEYASKEKSAELFSFLKKKK